MPTSLSLRALLIALLIASAALFAVGVAIERSQPTHSAAREATETRTDAPTPATETHAEDGATSGETSGEATTGKASQPAVKEVRGERVFGINPESIGLVIAAALASLLLALALWRLPTSPPLLAFVALVALAFAIFDIREAVHQVSESRTSLTVVASIVAALHLATTGLALALARRARPGDIATSVEVSG